MATKPKKAQWVIRIAGGYFGRQVWSASPRAEAYVLTMKDARRNLNRLHSVLGYPEAQIVPA